MSSHGYSEGWFYETHRILRDKYKTITICAEDCPHIDQIEIDQLKADFAGNPEFIEAVLGHDFIPLTEDAAINGRALDDLLANPPAKKYDGDTHAFCDFAWSGSGNQNVLALRRGNVITLEKRFFCDHLIASAKNPTPGVCDIFIAEYRRLGLISSQISGDEGGGGKLVMDELDRMGWILNRVNNGFPAADSEHYADTAAEIWYEGGKHITLKSFVLPNDQSLRGQLLSRKRRFHPKGKLAVETKEEMRCRNLPSPDEADAVLGCMADGGGYGGYSMNWAQALPVGKYQSIGAL